MVVMARPVTVSDAGEGVGEGELGREGGPGLVGLGGAVDGADLLLHQASDVGVVVRAFVAAGG